MTDRHVSTPDNPNPTPAETLAGSYAKALQQRPGIGEASQSGSAVGPSEGPSEASTGEMKARASSVQSVGTPSNVSSGQAPASASVSSIISEIESEATRRRISDVESEATRIRKHRSVSEFRQGRQSGIDSALGNYPQLPKAATFEDNFPDLQSPQIGAIQEPSAPVMYSPSTVEIPEALPTQSRVIKASKYVRDGLFSGHLAYGVSLPIPIVDKLSISLFAGYRPGTEGHFRMKGLFFNAALGVSNGLPFWKSIGPAVYSDYFPHVHVNYAFIRSASRPSVSVGSLTQPRQTGSGSVRVRSITASRQQRAQRSQFAQTVVPEIVPEILPEIVPEVAPEIVPEAVLPETVASTSSIEPLTKALPQSFVSAPPSIGPFATTVITPVPIPIQEFFGPFIVLSTIAAAMCTANGWNSNVNDATKTNSQLGWFGNFKSKIGQLVGLSGGGGDFPWSGLNDYLRRRQLFRLRWFLFALALTFMALIFSDLFLNQGLTIQTLINLLPGVDTRAIVGQKSKGPMLEPVYELLNTLLRILISVLAVFAFLLMLDPFIRVSFNLYQTINSKLFHKKHTFVDVEYWYSDSEENGDSNQDQKVLK